MRFDTGSRATALSRSRFGSVGGSTMAKARHVSPLRL